MCGWSGHSLEGGTMAFLCSELQVAVETQSQTKPCWHTECREHRMLLPPSGDMGQNRAIVPDQLGAINAPQPPSMTNTDTHKYQYTHRVDIFHFQFHILRSKNFKILLLTKYSPLTKWYTRVAKMFLICKISNHPSQIRKKWDTYTKAGPSAEAWIHSQHTQGRKSIMPTPWPWNEEHDSFPFSARQSCLNTGLSSDIQLWGKVLDMTHATQVRKPHVLRT